MKNRIAFALFPFDTSRIAVVHQYWYCRIIFVREEQYLLVGKIVLVRRDVMSSIASSIL